jgi:predicted methyltransferase
MVDAYHEFSHPAEMMLSIREALRPGGQVFLLEFRAEDESVPISRLHKMSEEQVRKEMEAVGLEFVVNHDFLPWQHFLVFRKP